MVTAWRSYDALEETIRRDSTPVAEALHQSPSLVEKWKKAPPTDEDPTYTGTRNPLDRLEIIIDTIERIDPSRAYTPIFWLCARFGFMPPVPLPDGAESDKDLLAAVLAWNKEFGETCQQISKTLEDGSISRQEYRECMREAMEDIQALLALLAKMEMKVK